MPPRRGDERKPLMERFDTLVKRAGEIYARATADSAAAADGQRDVKI